MADDTDALREMLWNMFEEHCTQARHHEDQRSTVASALVAIAGVITGIVTFDQRITLSDLPLTLMLTVIGVFGALFSAKHYERYNLHLERARTHRAALNELLLGKPLIRLKEEADAANAAEFPIIGKLRLKWFWYWIYVPISLLGLTLTIIAIIAPTPPDTGKAATIEAQTLVVTGVPPYGKAATAGPAAPPKPSGAAHP